MKKIFYGFVGLPNTWVDDNDKQYSESFFKDKDYNDYTFDNFYDMDAMFGHENSLFGTRGLPVGHPDRSSRSFDMYNKLHGPMIVRVLNNNLKESIRRALRELHSPSGNEHKPGRYVVHKSAPYWRENIELTGLQTSVGDCYQQFVGGEVECKPAIFATDSLNEKDMFDSTYDDDIWVIDTECAGVTWFKDKHFEGGDYEHHIVTFEDISPDCLKLMYKGTGKSY